MTTDTYTIEKIYTERECFHDRMDNCDTIAEIFWMVTEDRTGRTMDSYDRKKDAVARVANEGGTVSEIISWT